LLLRRARTPSHDVAISRSLVAEKRSAVMPSVGGSSSGCPSAVDAICPARGAVQALSGGLR